MNPPCTVQLGPGHIEHLGGRVEALAEKWETARKLAQFTRAGDRSGGGPPAWVPFGKKISGGNVDKNFKALSNNAAAGNSIAENNNLNEAEKETEFDSQRQGAIEEAARQVMYERAGVVWFRPLLALFSSVFNYLAPL